MTMPRRFAKLRNTTLADVETPDYVEITYAACAVEEAACGWGGWMIEGACRHVQGQRFPTASGDEPLPAACQQMCPNCGGTTFRASASLRVGPAPMPDA
ncbi:hypothetical protein [Phenylobacterium sp.]|uniref:hypothetical protein n=1 Tax=Phenylobacterium sp. TaxID=1871053 RepID=UPI0035ADBC0B